MNYKLDMGAWSSVFAVPSCVADYFRTASGDHIKVLLYLLKNAEYVCPSENIAKDCGISVSEADDAVLFWQNVGVISVNGGELAPMRPEVVSPVLHTSVLRTSGLYSPSPYIAPLRTPEKLAADREAEVKAALHSQVQFPPKEIASAVNNSDAVNYLFKRYETLSGKPPRHAEQQSLMTIIEDVKLPCEVAVMLVEYCFSIGKASPAYMRSVAEDWWNNGINTISMAEQRIKELKSSFEFESKLKRMFGLNSAFSAKQKKDIAEWAEFGMSDELFEEAYDITMRNTGKFSFSYMNKIIRGWNNDGIKNVSDIKKKTSDSGEGESSFDLDDIAEWTSKKYSNLHRKGGTSE